MEARLERAWYDRPTLTVARELVGKRLRCGGKSGIITETEAYVGRDDPACHAARGLTRRTRVMFGPPGHAYVYFIYGMHFCLNFVTEAEGCPAAVLVRGCYDSAAGMRIDGPGKLCRHFGITTGDNGRDLCDGGDFFVEDTDLDLPLLTTPRIGIRVGTDRPWRFVAADLDAIRP